MLRDLGSLGGVRATRNVARGQETHSHERPSLGWWMVP